MLIFINLPHEELPLSFCAGSTLDLVLPICHVKARPKKRRDVTTSSVAKLKAKCCKLSTSYCVVQYSVLFLLTGG